MKISKLILWRFLWNFYWIKCERICLLVRPFVDNSATIKPYLSTYSEFKYCHRWITLGSLKLFSQTHLIIKLFELIEKYIPMLCIILMAYSVSVLISFQMRKEIQIFTWISNIPNRLIFFLLCYSIKKSRKRSALNGLGLAGNTTNTLMFRQYPSSVLEVEATKLIGLCLI